MIETIKAIGNLGIGVTFVIALLSIFIEWVPVKINPIQWLGRRFNRHIEDKVDSINAELTQHIAEENRTRILKFQNECLRRQKHTKEEFDSVLKVCRKYQKLIEKYDLENGECEDAMKYIKRVYDKCLDQGDFVDLSTAPLSPAET